MNIGDALKIAGKEVVRNAIPGGGLLIDLINGWLDDPIDKDSTGDEALAKLPQELLLKKIDLEIEAHKSLQTMLLAPQTTRPKIAMGAFRVVAFSICVCFLMWAYGIIVGRTDLVASMIEGWPFVLSLTGPLVTLLLGYFGILRKEHDARLGLPVQSFSNKLLNKLMK